MSVAWGPLAWAVATELSHGKNKTKIMSIGTAGFWICAWAVTFTLPYLFDADQANLGPMVGWIYAGGGVISVVSTRSIFFLVDLHGHVRSGVDASILSARSLCTSVSQKRSESPSRRLAL
jgi:hypothetical protein